MYISLFIIFCGFGYGVYFHYFRVYFRYSSVLLSLLQRLFSLFSVLLSLLQRLFSLFSVLLLLFSVYFHYFIECNIVLNLFQHPPNLNYLSNFYNLFFLDFESPFVHGRLYLVISHFPYPPHYLCNLLIILVTNEKIE